MKIENLIAQYSLGKTGFAPTTRCHLNNPIKGAKILIKIDLNQGESNFPVESVKQLLLHWLDFIQIDFEDGKSNWPIQLRENSFCCNDYMSLIYPNFRRVKYAFERKCVVHMDM